MLFHPLCLFPHCFACKRSFLRCSAARIFPRLELFVVYMTVIESGRVQAVPKRIKGPAWAQSSQLLAAHGNVHIDLSLFWDWTGDWTWTSKHQLLLAERHSNAKPRMQNGLENELTMVSFSHIELQCFGNWSWPGRNWQPSTIIQVYHSHFLMALP